MRYRWFERVILIAGGGSIAASVILSRSDRQDPIEAAAQIMLFGVLIGAVHWGRKGGAAAAIMASLGYFLLRLPLATMIDGLSGDVLVLLLTRFLTFGVVGLAGGELCGRIKYFMAELEGHATIDQWTRVYNQAHIHKLLSNAQGQFARYGTHYSVVTLTLSPSLTADLRPTKQRSVLRAVADHIRQDVRLVDDVARLDDGRFLMLLPQTPKEGALIAGERVRAGARDVLGAKDSSLSMMVLGTEEDSEALIALQGSLAPAEPQEPSRE